MHVKRCLENAVFIVAMLQLFGCASLEDVVSPPGVTLRNVHAETLAFDQQTFLLSFDVTNPNPFPLPVSRLEYGVWLDGRRFASGDAASGIRIPALADGTFDVRVEMDLLNTVPDLLFVLRDGLDRDLPYRLEGRLHTGLPRARPVTFASEGDVRLLGR